MSKTHIKKIRREKKTHPGSKSALVAVRSVQSGRGICQNLREIFAVSKVPYIVLYDEYSTLQVQKCKVSNLACGPCICVNEFSFNQNSFFFQKKYNNEYDHNKDCDHNFRNQSLINKKVNFTQKYFSKKFARTIYIQ